MIPDGLEEVVMELHEQHARHVLGETVVPRKREEGVSEPPELLVDLRTFVARRRPEPSTHRAVEEDLCFVDPVAAVFAGHGEKRCSEAFVRRLGALEPVQRRALECQTPPLGGVAGLRDLQRLVEPPLGHPQSDPEPFDPSVRGVGVCVRVQVLDELRSMLGPDNGVKRELIGGDLAGARY